MKENINVGPSGIDRIKVAMEAELIKIRIRKPLLLLIFPILILIYIIIYHSFYFLLYPCSVVDPYIYYGYSPGFWAVDLAFWVLSPLMYIKFRKNHESRFLSIIYVLCLDASSVGAFLTFFCLVYGINIFGSQYYTYGFVLMLLFVVPVKHLKISWTTMLWFLVFPVVGLIWKFLGPGNIGYFVSSSVVIDMSMIVYCFYWNAKLIDAIPNVIPNAIPKGGYVE